MTLKELVYRIIGLYRAKHKNTDNLSTRLVESWIHSTRSLIVRQRLDKEIFTIEESYVQDLGPKELEPIDSSIFPDIPSGRKMKRTKDPIPQPIVLGKGIPGFLRVGPADRMESNFKVVSYETALVSGYGKFNSRDIYCFYLENHLYFISKDWNYFRSLDYVDVRGIFQNPIEAGYEENKPYPISYNIVELMEDHIIRNRLPLVMSGLADETANERDDIVNLPQGDA